MAKTEIEREKQSERECQREKQSVREKKRGIIIISETLILQFHQFQQK